MEDGARFESLFKEHADRIYRFCVRRTKDHSAAEDALATVFYEAWRRRHEIDLESREPLPWLYAVATNVLRNQQRARRRYENAIRRVSALASSEPGDDVAVRTEEAARARAALALIESLPPGQRDVAALCLVGDLSYADAAARLALPIGTVRSRLFRARARLRMQAGERAGCAAKGRARPPPHPPVATHQLRRTT